MKSRFIIEDKDIKILKSKNSNYSPMEGKLNQLYLNARLDRLFLKNGGPGSGFHGHVGIPGQRGGGAAPGSVGGVKEGKAKKDSVKEKPKFNKVKMSQSTCGIDGDRTLRDDEKVPRLAGLTSKQKQIESEFAQNWEDKNKRDEALKEVENQAVLKGNKDFNGIPCFETDGIKQLDSKWGNDKELKKLTSQEKDYKDRLYYEAILNEKGKLSTKDLKKYNEVKDTKPLTKEQQDYIDSTRNYRAENNSVLHQTSNALAKKGFENYVNKNKPSEIIVTLGGCASGKGYGLENPGVVSGTVKGKTMKSIMSGKNKVIWDSAGDQGGDELNWIAGIASKNGSKVIFVNTVTNPQAAAKNAVIRVQAQGRLVAAKTFNESYTKTDKNYQKFQNSNKNNPDYTFITIDNPGAGNGDPSIVTKNPYNNISNSEMKNLIKNAIQELPSQLRGSALKGADFEFKYL